MLHPNLPFFRSVGTMIGSIVGVGIFGLPYAVSRAGFPVGMLFLFVLAAMLMGMQLMYAEVAMQTEGKHRLVGYLRKYLGESWSWIGLGTLFASLIGAMLAYLIVGGQFLHLLLEPVLGGQEAVYSVALGAVAAFFIYKGLNLVSRLDSVIVSGLLLLFFVVFLASLPHVRLDHLRMIPAQDLGTLYGVVLFSLAGTGAIPEMKAVLGKKQWKNLPVAAIVGLLTVLSMYAAFSFAVVGVTGPNTTEEAFIGLVPVLGPSFRIVGALIGSMTILSIYTILGVMMRETLEIDFNMKKMPSWMLVAGVPLILFIVGFREFIGLVGFVGAVFTGLTGIMIVLMYERMRASPVCQEHKCFNVPSIVSWMIMGIFFIGMVVEIVSRI